jgi:hypothetical protein
MVAVGRGAPAWRAAAAGVGHRLGSLGDLAAHRVHRDLDHRQGFRLGAERGRRPGAGRGGPCRFRAGLALLVVAIAAGWSSLPTQPELLALVVAAAILLVLLWRPPAPSRRRAWPWLLATPLSLLVGLYGFHLGDR